ncbi:MAG: MFS transporter, partial [Candidatus Kariarchaeaceae archaeon]
METKVTPDKKNSEVAFKSWYMGIIGYFYFGQGYSLASMVLLLPLYIRSDLEAGNYTKSVVYSVIIIFPWYVKVIFGLITDNYTIGRYGRRKPYLIIATIFSIFGWLTIGLHHTANIPFILSGVCIAIGSALADSVVDGQTVELIPRTYVARMQGIAWGSRGLGIGLTGVVSAQIVDNYGWQAMFYTNSLFGISISIVVLILPQFEHKQLMDSTVLKKIFRIIFKTPQSKSQIQFFFLSGMSLSIVPLLSIIMEREFDYSIKHIGYGALAFAIGTFIGAIVNGIIFDAKESRSRIIVLFSSFAVSISLGILFVFTSTSGNIQYTYFTIIGITSGSY